MGTLWQDLRYGFRRLWKNPGFTAVAVLALVLGIGANSAIFSVVNPLLLRPLPYKDPDRLVVVLERNLPKGYDWFPVLPADFIDWRDQNQVFEHIAGARDWVGNLTGRGEPEEVRGVRVSASFFPMLGVKAALGRTFLPEEDQPGHHHVVILGHGLWQRRFGADPSIIGQTLTLAGESFTMVGILPPDFQFATGEFNLWIPLALEPQPRGLDESHTLLVFARLKPGVTLKQAQGVMDTIARRLEQQYPKTNTGWGVTVAPMHEFYLRIRNMRQSLLLLLGAVGFVLLMACVNVANLLLAQASARQKEMAIRAALGASRLRLIRQLLTESVLLALGGGAVGLLLAFWGMGPLIAIIPYVPTFRADAIGIDSRVLGFALAISFLTGIVFGLVPALQVSKLDLNESLKEGGRMPAVGSGRIRSVLVVSEIALALTLLIGAGLMLQSFLRLQRVNPGLNPDHLLTMNVSLPRSRYPKDHQVAAFYQQVLQRIESQPGAQSVGVVTQLPLSGWWATRSFTIEGRPTPASGDVPSAYSHLISPNYFRTMGIPLLKGRDFAERDTENTPRVIIISETMARRFWPDEDPIGKRIVPGGVESRASWYTIVGVVADVRHFGLHSEPKPEMYMLYLQNPWNAMTLVVRTASDPMSMAAAVQRQVWAVDKDQPVSNIKTMEQVISKSVASRRFSMLLLGIFAAVALLLAVVGIYGIISYSVTQRRHEIGVRMALGARPRDVLKLVVGQGIILASMGVAIGLALALALTRLMSSLLFGVSAHDPVTFVSMALLLAGVALLASYIPARKATRVDPMVALRYE